MRQENMLTVYRKNFSILITKGHNVDEAEQSVKLTKTKTTA